jgi:(1->4)-alpha-D-glucan 1-alpha-D-glucosylmutase
MENDAAFERLCAACGIAPQYHDIWGNVHQVSAASKRALLEAMGIAADRAADCEELAHDLGIGGRERALPPVQVVREAAGAPRIALGPAARPLRWTLTLEDGAQHSGDLRPSSLPLQDGRHLFTLPLTPPAGYHRLELEGAAMSLIVAPDDCHLPAALDGDGHTWGPAAQLYALRSARNWGIGDFTDLRNLARFAADADAGAGIVGVNQLHALFPANPAHASPYSPSSRMFLNVLYLDVAAVADFAESAAARERVASAAFQARLAALRSGELIDYAAVANVKFEVLELLYRNFSERHFDAGSDRGTAFRAWAAQRGDALHTLALFDALNEHFRQRDATVCGWHDWPEPYRDPDSADVQAFARDNRQRVTFFEYLQWQAELQLAAAGECIAQRGLALGLYRDLALGADRGGAETWFDRKLYALDASAGAPPDDFNLRGQDWGLPPFIPQRLIASAYEPFIALLRANMRHAGALRIDHVMGLARLFWVPRGAGPADGAYVAYPFQDLLGILALESRRNRCLVVGEDLGTVPDRVREALPPQRIFSYRPLYFERAPDGAFKAPSEYRPLAVVAASTHDLPTLAGWWRGSDLDTRERLELFPSQTVHDAQIEGRARDRPRLLQALARDGLWPAGDDDPARHPDMDAALARAVQVFLARTPAKILMIQPEDMLGQIEQVNLPASGDAYPNWRRRLSFDLERWADDRHIAALTWALRGARGATAARIPRATYRLQLHRDFTFSQAAQLVPYLHALGVSHCYASPVFSARPGSRHGYDVTDHNAFNPELGGTEGFETLVTALRAHGMGLMLDIVPNHIGVLGAGNAWWLDVLEHGPASRYAGFFDIDWQPQNDQLRGKVLLPVLGAQYGDVLESGDLKLVFDQAGGAFGVHYYEHECPVDPREYPRILGYRIERLVSRLGAGDAALIELQALVDAFGRLPRRDITLRQRKADRARDAAELKRRLAALCAASPTIAEFVAETVDALNGTPGDAQSFDAFDRLLTAQAWRLAYWRTASDDINYRRFFDVNDLAALSMERREVFGATHRLVLDLVAQRKVDALRVDHVDGLYDPVQYCGRLQQRAGGNHGDGVTTASSETVPLPLYLTVEKITASYERLPQRWPVHGTTGYRFANLVNGLFVDVAAAAKLARIYRGFIGEALDYDEVLHRSKHLIMNVSLAAELNMLANRARRIARMDRHTCDFTLNSLRDALAEVAACFPVYRTYVSSDGAADEDRRFINWAVEAAKKRSRAGELSVLDFVRGLLTTDAGAGHGAGYRDAVVAFAMKFQQFTAPVTAKGNEDTAFYRYQRLVALNDVGGDPREFGISLAAFHAASQDRARNWPHTMLATSTHDSKRAEDVRTRIDALSEMPALWRLHLRRWRKVNRGKLRVVDGMRAPSANDEYLLYQTLIGVWPPMDADAAMRAALAERVADYMLKAVREAKLRSSWLNPDTEYEEAVSAFVQALIAAAEPSPFLADFIPFQRQISRLGTLSSLALTLLKLTSPGVPDIYQGSELWDFSLVDPDNRRAVDFELRRCLLDDVRRVAEMDGAKRAARVAQLLDTIDDGRIKLYLNLCTLRARRHHEALFRDGDYLPLRVQGTGADHVCAFARYHQGEWSIAAVPRLFVALGSDGTWPLPADAWHDTVVEIPDGAPDAWNDVLTDASLSCAPGTRTIPATGLFACLPGALLFPVA